MKFVVRAAAAVLCLGLAGEGANAASQKEIDDAIKKGADYLRSLHGQQSAGTVLSGGGGNGIGPTCMAALAMLEAQVPAGDAAVKNVTAEIRNASYTAYKTYQVALCLMYLDRYGDPEDDPLIQILACRLLTGQTVGGGWSYDCPGSVTGFSDQQLRAIKAEKTNGQPRMHPEVMKYLQALMTVKSQTAMSTGDDNSNTQFAALAVWMARKHGVPVEDALNRIQIRFMGSQNTQGCWPYNGGIGNGPSGSPAMYCAGLIGLATAVGRREERRAKADAPKVEEPKPESKPDPKRNDDPLFNPPTKPAAEPKKPVRRPPDELDMAVQRAFAGLGAVVAESAQQGGGALILREGGMHGMHDLYLFWSMERTCVIYGVDKLGGVDWYQAGAHALVISQNGDGSWGSAKLGGYGSEVNTAFAVLFLCRSNLARDLSGKVQNDTYTTLSTDRNKGNNNSGSGRPGDTRPGGNASTTPEPAGPALPEVTGSDAAVMAASLVRAEGKEWKTQLDKLRASRGDNCTEALVTAVNRLEGDRLKEARQALADRLARMTAATLRWMAKSDEPELRRGAVLAMGMKDDKAHIPDLIEAIVDDEEIVVRAAKASLKSLTGKDFGPVNNATIGEKKIAAEGWREWNGKQKK